MSKRLVIAGAGGFGREVLGWVSSSSTWREKVGVNTVVFIDDDSPRIGLQAPVVSAIKSYIPEPDDIFVCAIGAPELRRQIVTSIESRGATASTFIDDRAVLGENVSVEAGSIVCPEVSIAAGVHIGRHVHLNIRSTLSHDVTVNDFATVSPSCNLERDVAVHESAFLGTAATITQGLIIGERSRVGAGAVVVNDVALRSTVVGNPARELGEAS